MYVAFGRAAGWLPAKTHGGRSTGAPRGGFEGGPGPADHRMPVLRTETTVTTISLTSTARAERSDPRAGPPRCSRMGAARRATLSAFTTFRSCARSGAWVWSGR